MTGLVIFVAGCQTALDLLDDLIHSPGFNDALTFLGKLDDEVTMFGNHLIESYRKVESTIQGFAEDLNTTLDELNHEYKTAMNKVQGFVNEASLNLTNFLDEQRAALDNLTTELQGLLNSAKAKLVRTAQEEVERIKNDDTLLVAANRGLDSFDKLQQGAFDTLDGLMKDVVGNLVDIQHMSLEGKITANANKQTPFVVIIKGRFGGKRDFHFRLEWLPWRKGADDMSLFDRLTSMLMAFLNGDDVGLSKVSKAVTSESAKPSEVNVGLSRGNKSVCQESAGSKGEAVGASQTSNTAASQEAAGVDDYDTWLAQMQNLDDSS